jgi:hypothetical protein
MQSLIKVVSFAVPMFLRMVINVWNPIWQIRQRQLIRKAALRVIDELVADGSGVATRNRFSTTANGIPKTNYLFSGLKAYLRNNPDRLLQFAAQKDLTIENFLFLKQVLEFKGEINYRKDKAGGLLTPPDKYVLFGKAVELYTRFLNPSTAVSALNVKPRTANGLRSVFHGAAKLRFTPDIRLAVSFNWKDPRDIDKGLNYHYNYARFEADVRNSMIPRARFTRAWEVRGIDGKLKDFAFLDVQVRIPWGLDLPEGFDEGVFDEAIADISPNAVGVTWARFLDAEGASFNPPGAPPGRQSRSASPSEYEGDNGQAIKLDVLRAAGANNIPSRGDPNGNDEASPFEFLGIQTPRGDIGNQIATTAHHAEASAAGNVITSADM